LAVSVGVSVLHVFEPVPVVEPPVLEVVVVATDEVVVVVDELLATVEVDALVEAEAPVDPLALLPDVDAEVCPPPPSGLSVPVVLPPHATAARTANATQTGRTNERRLFMGCRYHTPPRWRGAHDE
jgi:hypothetical protein